MDPQASIGRPAGFLTLTVNDITGHWKHFFPGTSVDECPRRIPKRPPTKGGRSHRRSPKETLWRIRMPWPCELAATECNLGVQHRMCPRTASCMNAFRQVCGGSCVCVFPEQLLYAQTTYRIKQVRRHRCTGIIDRVIRLHEGLPCDDAKASAH